MELETSPVPDPRPSEGDDMLDHAASIPVPSDTRERSPGNADVIEPPSRRPRIHSPPGPSGTKRASTDSPEDAPAHVSRRLVDYSDDEDDLQTRRIFAVSTRDGLQEVEIATAEEDELQALDDPIIQEHLLQ